MEQPLQVDAMLYSEWTHATLRAALRSRFGDGPRASIHVAASLSELLGRLSTRVADLAVVQPCPSAEGANRLDAEWERLRAVAHRGSVVVCAEQESPRPASERRPVGPRGFPIVVSMTQDDSPKTLRRALATALLRAALEERRLEIQARLGYEQTSLVIDLLTIWPRPERVACLARRLSISERTLRDAMTRKGLPPPRHLRGASLLLEAQSLRRIGVTTVQSMACHLGFDHPGSLTRLCLRMARRSVPSVLQGPPEWVLAALLGMDHGVEPPSAVG